MEGLLLFRANPHKEWNAETIARGLFINESQAAVLLAHLLEHGFIATAASGLPSHYKYQPISPERAEMVERMADLYRQYLLPITNLIHSKPKSRIQEFADAFKLRKD